MLLEFKTSNYKSFKGEMLFSLVPTSSKHLAYSVLKDEAGGKSYKGLSSAVIYGPNASGKTNIIGAMDTFRGIVLRGHIRNSDPAGTNNIPVNHLEMIPNSSLNAPEPVSFGIKFTVSNMMVEYALAVDLGVFMDEKYPRKILYEALWVNDSMIFIRDSGLKFGRFHNISCYMSNAFSQNAEAAKMLASDNLNDDELFLMNGFKTIFSPKLVAIIADWFKKKFVLCCKTDFGGCFTTGESKDKRLHSLFNSGKKTISSVEMCESYGTIRFINIFPMVADVLANGGTLVADEFDASIHPMAIMNIINIFHNDEINVNHAQLIFNTHNPIFLNANLFRRDEIKFVDHDDESYCSNLYSLADFKGSSCPDYMKDYFAGRYGAIRDIDFAPVFKDLLRVP